MPGCYGSRSDDDEVGVRHDYDELASIALSHDCRVAIDSPSPPTVAVAPYERVTLAMVTNTLMHPFLWNDLLPIPHALA